MRIRYLITFFIYLCLSWAKGGLNYKLPETSMVFSCLITIDSNYKFDYQLTDHDNYWTANCHYPPKTQTFTACFEESKLNFNKSLDIFHQMCTAFGGFQDVTVEHLMKVHQNGTRYLIRHADLDPNSDHGDRDSDRTDTDNDSDALHNDSDQQGVILLQHPIIPDINTVWRYEKAYRAYFDSIDKATDFGNYINYYWITVFCLLSIFNYLKNFNTIKTSFLFKNWAINKLRANFTIPTLFNNSNRLQPTNFLTICETLFPSMQEFYILIIYFVVCLYAIATTYHIYPENPLFGDIYHQWTRFIADRAGILAFTNLPLLFLFGGRNNLLIKFTGLQYSSFIIFHKWIGRLMFWCALLHGAGYSAYAMLNGKFRKEFYEAYWNYGVLALASCFVLLLLAVYRFRKNCYEFFLIAHILLAFIFIGACVLHCWTIGWLQWCYFAIAFWALDRSLRILRIVRFGFQKANCEILSLKDPTLKLTIPIPPNSNFFKPFPGSYVFLHFMDKRFKFWESHPFSIYSINDTEFNIIIKPKLGATYKLYKHLQAQCEQDAAPGDRTTNHQKHGIIMTQIRVAVEGPYGHHVPHTQYDQVLLIAGGNGIPGPYYHAVKLATATAAAATAATVARASSSSSSSDITNNNNNNNSIEVNGDVELQQQTAGAFPINSSITSIKKTKLCWVIRDLESLIWFKTELKHLISLSDYIQVQIFVTREKLPANSIMCCGGGVGNVGYGSTKDNCQAILSQGQGQGQGQSNRAPCETLSEGAKLYISLFRDNANATNFEFYNTRPDAYKLMRNCILYQKEFASGTGSGTGSKSHHSWTRAASNHVNINTIGQSINVISCGNPVMCDMVRNSCAKLMGEFVDVRIDLYEELQVW